MRLTHALITAAMLSFAAPAFADEYVVMKVNGTDVSNTEVQKLIEGVFPPGQAPAFDTMKPDMQEKILRGLMAERLIYGEALKQGADKSDKIQQELEGIKKKLVVRSFLDTKTSAMITDADVKNEYDALVASMRDAREVHARHILVTSEAEAKEVKKKIDDGKSFEDVAKESSKDSGSATKGGDLGYFTKDKMVKEFADAAFAMKKGEVSGPVKSDFGYHIIKAEDNRKVTVPTLKDVKDELKAKLQAKKLEDYVGGLVKAADVKVFDPKGKEVPFEKNLTGGAAPAAAAKPADKADKAK